MVYTTKQKIRDLTNLVIADITDDELDALIVCATTQLNSDINTPIVRERVVQIDNTRTNKINGTNTTFYVQNWKGKYIGDSNDDGAITATDVVVHLVASDNTESTATVSSVTSGEGKYVLSSAPTDQTAAEMYVTYNWCFVDPSTPSAKISLACAFLVIAYAYEKINRGMSPQQVYGNVRFMRDMRAGNEFFKKYEAEVSKINDEMGDYEESEIF